MQLSFPHIWRVSVCPRVLGPWGGWAAALSDPPPGPPLQTNEKGQVVTKTALLKQMEELIEEPGLTCCICREGYKFQVRCRAPPGLTSEDQPSSSEAAGGLI